MKYDADIFDTVEFGDLESVKLYWSEETNIDCQDCNGMTLLMYSVSYTNVEVVNFY